MRFDRQLRAVLGAFALAAGLALAPLPVSAESWQCVPFARMISGIQIFGDAHTWWSKARGRYETGQAPATASVLVFKPQGRMNRGHVAVVSEVLTERIIKVTHANWSDIDGRRGQIEQDVTVADVSERGDWTKVKVWYAPIDDLGTTAYPTHGFIYQDQEAVQLASRPAPAAIASIGSRSPGADPIAGLIQQVSLLRD